MEAPKCPNCGRELETVIENVYLTYEWFPKEKLYKEKSYLGELYNLCPYCEIDLYDLFPDGVCNYTGEE